MLHRSIAALGLALTSFVAPAHAQICTPFTDVSAQDTFCKNIQWMFNRNITLGCTATSYCPTQFVSRDQMAAFMNRLGDVVFEQGGSAFGATAVLGTSDNQALDVRVNNERVMRFEPNAVSPNVISGSAANTVTAGRRGATIAGGGVSGNPNLVASEWSTVGGGLGNQAGNVLIQDGYQTIGGGESNQASGPWSTVGGGYFNNASGFMSTIPGGRLNWAGGPHSVAMGYRALVLPAAGGSFVYADSTNADFASHGPNEFLVAASGGIGLYTSKTGTTYCRMDAGGGSMNCSSSREVKRDFAPVDTRDALEKVASLSLTSWRFMNEREGVRHLGPMAEDFRAAFGLGSDERSISSVDAQGVALAAIQGLNAKLELRLRAKDAELAELRRTVEWLLARASCEANHGAERLADERSLPAP